MGKKAQKVARATVVVGASLEPETVARLDAYGEAMRKKDGLRVKRGTIAGMLIRQALDALRAELRGAS